MANNPSLPRELWRLILREATYVPKVFTSTWDFKAEERLWVGWEDEDPYKIGFDFMGLGTKCSIVQVCRDWRDIGVEFLYEVICLPGNPSDHGQTGFQQLVEAMTAPAALPPSGYSHGWWTKRIVCRQGLLVPGRTEPLFSLLEQCHNLQIFSVMRGQAGSSPEIQTRLVRLLESKFSHSLRRVQLYMDSEAEGHPDVMPRIAGLKTLGIMVQDGHHNWEDELVFENITTLTVGLPSYINKFPSRWNFPRLQTLAVYGVSDSDIHALTPFVEKHNETLLHLFLATTSVGNHLLPSFISKAPHLRSLVFDKGDLETLDVWRGTNTTLPELTHLGVSCDIQKQESHPWMLDNLKRMVEGRLFPGLRVLRLLSESNPASPGFTWQDAVELCERHNIRLEDRRGKLLSESGDL